MNYKVVLFAVLLAAGSCTEHEDLAGGAVRDGSVSGTDSAYVTVELSMPGGRTAATTRANPTGGETGDGTEPGQDYENSLSWVRIYFFKHNDGGLNGPAETPVAGVADFYKLSPDATNTSYGTETKCVRLSQGPHDVVAVANVDPLKLDEAGITTLGQLRDFVQPRAWTEYGDGSYGQFVMASADETDTPVDIVHNTITDEPIKVTVDVERHAARVDYKAKARYECTDAKVEGAEVEIIGAKLVNNLTAGTYMLKRVADEVGGEVTYLGEETTDDDGFATNYVIDPWTIEKRLDNEEIDSIFGVLYAESPYVDFWDEYITDGEPLTAPDADGAVWKRAAYTMENITDATQTSQQHNTGMVFKARFHPGKLAQSRYDATATYRDGSTFFVWGAQIFADVESVMEAWLSEKGYAIGYMQTLMDNVAGLAEKADTAGLRALAESLPADDPVGYRTWLLEQVCTAQESGVAEGDWQEAVRWPDFMKTAYGYVRRQNDADGNVDVSVNGDGLHTRILLAPHGVIVYRDALCYYLWWIRHCNDNDDKKNGKMEYAIVRNNIYKLEVVSVAELGSPTIPLDEKIRIRVYVRDWQLLRGETMEM